MLSRSGDFASTVVRSHQAVAGIECSSTIELSVVALHFRPQFVGDLLYFLQCYFVRVFYNDAATAIVEPNSLLLRVACPLRKVRILIAKRLAARQVVLCGSGEPHFSIGINDGAPFKFCYLQAFV